MEAASTGAGRRDGDFGLADSRLLVLVLAIESAADAAGVALADDQGTLAQATLGRGRRHAETIAPSIRSCCAAAAVNLRQVDAIVVDSGPGLFTGLRVGVGTAKALAYALGTPLVAVSSLDALACAAAPAHKLTSASTSSQSDNQGSTPLTDAESSDQTIVAVLDARRGEVVSAEFTLAADGGASGHLVRVGEDCLEAPAALASRLTTQLTTQLTTRLTTRHKTPRGAGSPAPTTTLVGDGALRYAEMFSEVPGALIGARWLASPPVAVVAEMGVELALLGRFEDPLTLSPRYVRRADARINWASRAPRTGTEAGTEAGAEA